MSVGIPAIYGEANMVLATPVRSSGFTKLRALTAYDLPAGAIGPIGPAGTTGTMSLYGASAVSILGALGTGNMSQSFNDGIFSAATGAFPSSVHLSAINQTGANLLDANYAFVMRNY